MRLKSYFANTVEAALNTARQELGPDAMLVDSRRTGQDTRHLGDYEVVCAVIPPKTPEPDPQPQAASSGIRSPHLDKLSQEVSDLKRYMERMAATIARSSSGLASLRANPRLAEAFAILSAAEVEASLAYDMVASMGDGDIGEQDVTRLLANQIQDLIVVDTRLGCPGAKQSIAAFVGPPGAGKTTALVKLAAQVGLGARRPAQILSVDTYRVAAAEQLRSYASILGMGFQLLETPTALAQSLEEHKHKDLILIDTPGFGRHELSEARDIARFLSTHPGIDVHLVLPLSMRSADIRTMTQAYEVFRPAKVLYTRTDEMETYGSILNIAAATGKPVSFLSSGQQIPEDLEPAKREKLIGLILKKSAPEELTSRAVAAA